MSNQSFLYIKDPKFELHRIRNLGASIPPAGWGGIQASGRAGETCIIPASGHLEKAASTQRLRRTLKLFYEHVIKSAHVPSLLLVELHERADLHWQRTRPSTLSVSCVEQSSEEKS